MVEFRSQLENTNTPVGMTHNLRPMTRNLFVARGLFMLKKLSSSLLVIFIASSLVSPLFAADLSLDDLINKIQSNQSKIHDMYAETETTIVSNMAIPGQENKGPQKMIQGLSKLKNGKTEKLRINEPGKSQGIF